MVKKEQQNLTKSDRIKVAILEALSNRGSATYYGITKETKTSFESLVPNCYFLQLLGLVTIEKAETPGMNYHKITITDEGREALALLKKM